MEWASRLCHFIFSQRYRALPGETDGPSPDSTVSESDALGDLLEALLVNEDMGKAWASARYATVGRIGARLGIQEQ